MRWRRESAIDLYNLLFGVFLFASPWLFAYVSEKVRFDVWISGAAVVAVSIAAIVAFSDWEEWFNLALGVWLMGSPWVLGFTHTRPMHVCIAIGAMVAFVAALELWLSKYDPTYASNPHKPQRSSDLGN
jgi:predicted MFS family arabinose efflux permease